MNNGWTVAAFLAGLIVATVLVAQTVPDFEAKAVQRECGVKAED